MTAGHRVCTAARSNVQFRRAQPTLAAILAVRENPICVLLHLTLYWLKRRPRRRGERLEKAAARHAGGVAGGESFGGPDDGRPDRSLCRSSGARVRVARILAGRLRSRVDRDAAPLIIICCSWRLCSPTRPLWCSTSRRESSKEAGAYLRAVVRCRQSRPGRQVHSAQPSGGR